MKEHVIQLIVCEQWHRGIKHVRIWIHGNILSFHHCRVQVKKEGNEDFNCLWQVGCDYTLKPTLVSSISKKSTLINLNGNAESPESLLFSSRQTGGDRVETHTERSFVFFISSLLHQRIPCNSVLSPCRSQSSLRRAPVSFPGCVSPNCAKIHKSRFYMFSKDSEDKVDQKQSYFRPNGALTGTLGVEMCMSLFFMDE